MLAPRRLRLIPAAVFLLSAALHSARAQADATPAPTASPSPSPAPLIERTIYTPYEKLEQVFGKEDRGVFLPYREFLDLWNKVNLPSDLKKNPPPVDGVLASAHYAGAITGDAAVFDAQLQLEALKEGWSKIPLGAADLDIAEVKPQGSPAAVLHLAADGYEAILPAKGSYPITLTVLGKVTRDAGRSTLTLRLPRTAASQFELKIPETGLEFTLTPACAYTSKEENGATQLAAFFGSSQEVTLSWHQRAAETALPALVFAESALNTTVSPGALRTVADIDFRLLRAPVGAFEILVPAGQQVLGVEGNGLRDWNLAPAAPDGRQRIAVNLAAPARDTYKLRVTLEAPIGALPAKLTVPALEIALAEGQSGTVTIGADPALAVTIDPREGVTQQGVPANPQPAASVFLGAYRFLHLPFAVDLDVRAAEPVVDVNTGTLYTVTPDTLEMASLLRYSVRKAGVFSVTVDVPAGLEHVEAKGDPIESFSTLKQTPAFQRLEVRFKERLTGDFNFTVTGDSPRAKPDDAVTISVPHPVGAARDEGQVAVAIHQSLDPKTTDAGDLKQEGIEHLQTPAPGDPAVTPVTLGFSYKSAVGKPASLAFTLRKPRVSAEVASRVSLKESLVSYQWTIVYTIEYAGIDDLVINAPPSIAADLQFTGDDIMEKARDDKYWHVRLRQKKLGRYELRASVERPAPPLGAGMAATVDWPELKTVDVFHETGTVAVVKEGNLEITRATPKGLELIDPSELPDFARQNADVFLAYRYAAHPVSLEIEFSKNEFLPAPTAIVSYAVLNTTITPDRAETTEAIYWVLNNGRQFLSIALPERGQMLSDVFVNGQPQQPSRRPDNKALLVRLPARGAGQAAQAGDQAPVSVRLVYSVPADPGGRSGMGWLGHLHAVPPVIEETRVLQTQYALYLPTGYRYVSFSGPMREIYGRRGWNWLRWAFDPLVPALGPDGKQVTTAAWQEPPELPPMAGGGFDSPVPKEGTPVVLRRLDAPAPVVISFRSLGYANTIEALGFFAAAGFGLSLLGSSRKARLGYFFIVGVGSLILAGAVAPRASGLWSAIYLGVFFAALAWIAAGSWKWLRRVAARLGERRRVAWAKLRARLKRPPAIPPPAVPPGPAIPPASPGAA